MVEDLGAAAVDVGIAHGDEEGALVGRVMALQFVEWDARDVGTSFREPLAVGRHRNDLVV